MERQELLKWIELSREIIKKQPNNLELECPIILLMELNM